MGQVLGLRGSIRNSNMSLKVLLAPGDCFSIPLPDGRFAFGQYLCFHERTGTLIQVFDVGSPDLVPLERLTNAGLLFPPVSVGLNPPIRMGRWRKIGNIPVGELQFPKFRYSFGRVKGVNHDWEIFDGEKYERVGDLPPEYRSLEMTGTYAYQAIEERILTGRNPFAEGVE
jgi:hypothetical protein